MPGYCLSCYYPGIKKGNPNAPRPKFCKPPFFPAPSPPPERTKLKDCEYPLVSRILHGPCEKIARIFLMEADLGEEVPHDVSRG